MVANGIVYTSGQIPAQPGGEARVDFEVQLEATLANLRTLLDAVGSGLDHVLKVNGYLIDRSQLEPYNRIRRRPRCLSPLLDPGGLRVLPGLRTRCPARRPHRRHGGAAREELTDDAIITFGAGNHAVWPARYLTHHKPATLTAPRNGAVGMGIPAAVVGYGAPFVAIVVDNGQYATIREHQEMHYPGRPSGTHLTNPDFAAFARSFGAHGETVDRTSGFRDAYRRARASGRPAVLHLRQDPAVRALATNS